MKRCIFDFRSENLLYLNSRKKLDEGAFRNPNFNLIIAAEVLITGVSDPYIHVKRSSFQSQWRWCPFKSKSVCSVVCVITKFLCESQIFVEHLKFVFPLEVYLFVHSLLESSVSFEFLFRFFTEETFFQLFYFLL